MLGQPDEEMVDMNEISVGKEVVDLINKNLGEGFIKDVIIDMRDGVETVTVDYGSVKFNKDQFNGHPDNSLHDLIKYELYNQYLYEMNTEDKSMFQVASEREVE